jgi:hypothetical protein
MAIVVGLNSALRGSHTAKVTYVVTGMIRSRWLRDKEQGK